MPSWDLPSAIKRERNEMQTIIKAYRFDVTTAEGKRDWEAFRAAREAEGARIHGPVYTDRAGDLSGHDGATITLETVHLFDNQWNATFPDGRAVRVFDWLLEAEQSHPSQTIGAPRGIKRGHYLEQTEEMRRIRAETLKCGYCGKQEPADGIDLARAFCPHCRGSQYLKPDDLHLTRLVPVAQSGAGRKVAPLTDAERAYLMALYEADQRESARTAAGEKLRKFRAGVIAKADKTARDAATEREGMLWLLDHDLGGIAADNVLFYNHTGRFSFGWRTPIADSLASEIMGKLSDEGFPFPYDVITAERGKLSGAVEG